MTRLAPVASSRELKAFIDFPHKLYKDDQNYVPELFIAQRDMLTPGKHPFHKHSTIQPFLAYNESNEIVGRIAAILNNNHNQYYQVNDGFFGFFECIDNQEIANLLIDTASRWVKEKGATKLVGPASFSSNEVYGLLVEGFDSPPVAMMPYNPPYYKELLEKAGLAKQVDLYAYDFDPDNYDDKSKRLLNALQERLKRNNIVIRKINMKKFDEDVAKVHQVYNSAWSKNAGAVPATDDEFNYLAKDLKMILDPDFCVFAEQEGKIVGLGLAIPDINQILIKIKRGRLLPTGIFKLLFGKKKITGIRILLLGVVDGYRKMGIEACLYGTIIQEFERKKLKHAEASWTLEQNTLVNSAIESINGKLYKKYRVFEKPI